jgi:hypothetical protein
MTTEETQPESVLLNADVAQMVDRANQFVSAEAVIRNTKMRPLCRHVHAGTGDQRRIAATTNGETGDALESGGFEIVPLTSLTSETPT